MKPLVSNRESTKLWGEPERRKAGMLRVLRRWRRKSSANCPGDRRRYRCRHFSVISEGMEQQKWAKKLGNIGNDSRWRCRKAESTKRIEYIRLDGTPIRFASEFGVWETPIPHGQAIPSVDGSNELSCEFEFEFEFESESHRFRESTYKRLQLGTADWFLFFLRKKGIFGCWLVNTSIKSMNFFIFFFIIN